MGILEKIADIEKEMARTQKNKAVRRHLHPLPVNKRRKPRANLLPPSLLPPHTSHKHIHHGNHVHMRMHIHAHIPMTMTTLHVRGRHTVAFDGRP